LEYVHVLNQGLRDLVWPPDNVNSGDEPAAGKAIFIELTVDILCLGVAVQKICDMGYSSMDIIQTLFRVVKNDPKMPEFLKLEFIRVSPLDVPPTTLLTAS
jgi:hypothetical protein